MDTRAISHRRRYPISSLGSVESSSNLRISIHVVGVSHRATYSSLGADAEIAANLDLALDLARSTGVADAALVDLYWGHEPHGPSGIRG